MARRREVIGPDGTVYDDANAAAIACGCASVTIRDRCRRPDSGWCYGSWRGLPAGSSERGALISPTSILEQQPLDPNDGRYWM